MTVFHAFVRCASVQYDHKDAGSHEYIINSGYELDYLRGTIRSAPRFNNLCGSSGIFCFESGDLPLSYDVPGMYVSDHFGRHTKWRETARSDVHFVLELQPTQMASKALD
jgi:hypothetical protein